MKWMLLRAPSTAYQLHTGLNIQGTSLSTTSSPPPSSVCLCVHVCVWSEHLSTGLSHGGKGRGRS